MGNQASIPDMGWLGCLAPVLLLLGVADVLTTGGVLTFAFILLALIGYVIYRLAAAGAGAASRGSAAILGGLPASAAGEGHFMGALSPPAKDASEGEKSEYVTAVSRSYMSAYGIPYNLHAVVAPPEYTGTSRLTDWLASFVGERYYWDYKLGELEHFGISYSADPPAIGRAGRWQAISADLWDNSESRVVGHLVENGNQRGVDGHALVVTGAEMAGAIHLLLRPGVARPSDLFLTPRYKYLVDLMALRDAGF